jgi:hypothetical protein
VFDAETPYDLIKALQPDVLVKGADWADDAIVGRDIVEQRGGRVVRVPLEPGCSTSVLIRRIASASEERVSANHNHSAEDAQDAIKNREDCDPPRLLRFFVVERSACPRPPR